MVLSSNLVMATVVIASGCGELSHVTPAPEVPVASTKTVKVLTPAQSPPVSVQGAESEVTSTQEDTQVEHLVLSGVALSLSPKTCRLQASVDSRANSHHFDFPGECHFSPAKSPWIVETKYGKAVLVAGSTSKDNGECDTALQLIVITEQGLELSEQIQRVSSCALGRWDEMMYHVMSSRRVLIEPRRAAP